MVVVIVVTALTALWPGPASAQALTERVSVSSTGEEGASWSHDPAISFDGRFVVFASLAGNLVGDDTNGVYDVFLRDRQTGTTERLSLSTAGIEGDDDSSGPSVSADGRFVVFTSLAANLVSGDTNFTFDVLVRDRELGTTERVNLSSSGEQANGSSGSPVISSDGRIVVFTSLADNLVSGDINNHVDVFLRDLQSGTTELVSVSSGGAQGNAESGWAAVSADGGVVTFTSDATNLVSVDDNDSRDVFARDRRTGTTELVSLSSVGDQGNGASSAPAVSADGRVVAFESWASNLIPGDTNEERDIFVRDRVLATLDWASVSTIGIGGSRANEEPTVSADGSRAVFLSYSPNLVPGDTNLTCDVFLRDRPAHRTDLLSRSSDGTQGTSYSTAAAISGDGRWVAFESRSSNLVPGDTNSCTDIFVRGPLLDTIFADGFESGETTAWDLALPD